MNDGPPTAGHVKVSRKVFDAVHGDPLWLEKREFSRWEAWIDVIQLAAWKDSPYHTSSGIVRLRRGEFMASRRYLAKRWNWTEKRVRVWLDFMLDNGRLRTSSGPTLGPSEVSAQQRDSSPTPASQGPDSAHGGALTRAHSATVYLIVKYDAYQSTESSKGPVRGPQKGQHSGAETPEKGPKIEAVKAVRTKKLTDAGASAANLEAFPKSVCDAGHERWSSSIGAMPYGRFRRVLLPLYQAQPRCYDAAQLVSAIDAFVEAMTGDDPRWRGKWTVNRFAAELHQWARLGEQELVDEWGLPTDRGRAAGVFAA